MVLVVNGSPFIKCAPQHFRTTLLEILVPSDLETLNTLHLDTLFRSPYNKDHKHNLFGYILGPLMFVLGFTCYSCCILLLF